MMKSLKSMYESVSHLSHHPLQTALVNGFGQGSGGYWLGLKDLYVDIVVNGKKTPAGASNKKLLNQIR